MKKRPSTEKERELSDLRAVVVVVDDDPAVRNSLKFSLEMEGFYVRSYANADELLSLGDLASCSCLVIDQRLPGMSGLDLIAALRARQVVAPAILITSHPSTALSEQAARTHVPIVEKPLLGNGLLDKIHDAVATQGR
jgi:two-component system, LuxR family, response regulator FixJ